MGMSVNMTALRQRIHDRGYTIETLADKMNIDRATIYRKMKRDGETFTIGQIHQISDILCLSADEAKGIFLSRNSQ